MRISFDLDDTLICAGDVPCEPRLPWPTRWLVRDEPLRVGTPGLVRDLKSQGFEVWVYTTSHRNPFFVRLWLRCHGVSIDGMINQAIHERHVRSADGQQRIPSKNPSSFGIDLHVDDSEGVLREGETHGFRVVVVTPADRDWCSKVIMAAAECPTSN